MKKLIVALLVSVMLVFGITTDYKIDGEKETYTRTVPEQIMETVLIVENSTGIVVHVEDDRALILTARHNIEDILAEFECPACLVEMHTVLLIQIPTPEDGLLEIPIHFPVTAIYEDGETDLALLEVEADFPLEAVQIMQREIKLGEDIWLGSNPHHIYRSLKKGIVSSTFRIVRGKPAMEISGGVIFGSSGGGVFTMDGKLAGIILSVRLLESNFCLDLYDEDDNFIEEECVMIPVPFLGFAATPDVIRNFVLKSDFKEDFKYLEVK